MSALKTKAITSPKGINIALIHRRESKQERCEEKEKKNHLSATPSPLTEKGASLYIAV